MSVEAKLEIEEDDYVEQFKPFMMDIVAAWCKGAFSKVSFSSSFPILIQFHFNFRVELENATKFT